jgi:hypothetical protein
VKGHEGVSAQGWVGRVEWSAVWGGGRKGGTCGVWIPGSPVLAFLGLPRSARPLL